MDEEFEQWDGSYSESDNKLSDKITKADTKSIHEEPTKIDYTTITTSKCAIGNIHTTRKATANY